MALQSIWELKASTTLFALVSIELHMDLCICQERKQISRICVRPFISRYCAFQYSTYMLIEISSIRVSQKSLRACEWRWQVFVVISDEINSHLS